MIKPISFRNDVLPLKNLLYRLALRITLNSAEAEDIVQDTLIKVWNKRDSWGEIESIEAFSTTICRNLALDRISKRDNQNASLEEHNIDRQDTASDPFEHTQQRNRVELVKQIIDSLPLKQRECIQLRDFEGKAYKEVAELLGITEEQVKVNIFRARQTIKQRFTEIDGYGL